MINQDNTELIYENIIENMSDGVMVIGFNGVITFINNAAAQIIGMEREKLLNSKLAKVFFQYDENDELTQLLLDSVYEGTERNSGMVGYFNGENKKTLYVTTAYLRNDNKEQKAVIVLLSDFTELHKLEEEKDKITSTFGRYLSDDIVKSLLSSPDGLALGGKKCEVTIMMTDLRGFTTMSETMLPVDIITMLNNYLGEMVNILEKYGGTVIEFIGDAILAVFGEPRKINNPEASAVACAIEMQNRMKSVNDFNKKNNFPDIEMGIGINSGIAVLGNIGSEKCTKYSIIGKNVNLCSRIEGYTVGGQILVSESVKKGIDIPLTIRGEVSIFPKGIKIPLTVYDIAAIGGEYNVECSDDDNTRLVDVNDNITINMFRISSKHVSEEPVAAKLVRVCERRAEVVISGEASEEIPEFSDFQLVGVSDSGFIVFSDVFCKVIGKEDNKLLLHFTAVNNRMTKFVLKYKSI